MEHKCIECDHCDAENLMCYPKSEDCMSEYKLEEKDLYTPARCDFFHKKGKIS